MHAGMTGFGFHVARTFLSARCYIIARLISEQAGMPVQHYYFWFCISQDGIPYGLTMFTARTYFINIELVHFLFTHLLPQPIFWMFNLCHFYSPLCISSHMFFMVPDYCTYPGLVYLVLHFSRRNPAGRDTRRPMPPTKGVGTGLPTKA